LTVFRKAAKKSIQLNKSLQDISSIIFFMNPNRIVQFVLVLIFLSCNQYSSKKLHSQTYRSLNGNWVHEQDSLSSVIVHNKQWTFNDKGYKHSEEDQYQIRLSNSLPQYADEKVKGEFLLLIKKADTNYYEIIGLSDSTLSLMHFPSGRINVYLRTK
jgi:hypothetical protein